MAIRAYDESYLANAQNILGHSVDFAVMSINLDPDVFGNTFAVSDASKQFAIGNPRYVAGINGCELARLVLTDTHTPFSDTDDAMYLDKSAFRQPSLLHDCILPVVFFPFLYGYPCRRSAFTDHSDVSCLP